MGERGASRARAASNARAAIVAAALDLLAERGYGGTSLQGVAERAGIRKSSIFYHFAGKERLVEAVYAECAGPLLAELVQLAADPPSLDQLLSVIDGLLVRASESPARASLCLRLLLDAPLPSPDLLEEGPRHELLRPLAIAVTWFERAERVGAIRPVGPTRVLTGLLGGLLFYPAVVREGGTGILGALDPDATAHASQALAAWRGEVRELVRAALTPQGLAA
jgi:AcrR family transcriptional regulator